MKSLYIFTRDLRTYDNRSFYDATMKSTELIPVFIFTPEQVMKRRNNDYRSNNAIQFMVESLKDLDNQLDNNLNLFYGSVGVVVEALLRESIRRKDPIDYIYMAKDYTPYSVKRGDIIRRLCEKYGNDRAVIFNEVEDYCLYNPGEVLTGGGAPYQKYTPYYRAALKNDPPGVIKKNGNVRLIKLRKGSGMSGMSGMSGVEMYNFRDAGDLYVENMDINRRGGRIEGLKLLNKIGEQKDYGKTRNDLERNTTELSAYIKFGNISIREVYWKVRDMFGVGHGLIGQLVWHDFYYQLGYAFPEVFGSALKEKYNGIKWSNDKGTLNAWKDGRTGFPIVDACMMQLNETGYMHNRGRLIVGSFLVKLLLHDWQDGEKYFAQRLSDYDPLVNNGNWQWVASTGADSQPYFRIFNPWLQSKRFDPRGTYIKRWLPELKDIPAKELHEWDRYYLNYTNLNYPKPIINYKRAKEMVLEAYKRVLK